MGSRAASLVLSPVIPDVNRPDDRHTDFSDLDDHCIYQMRKRKQKAAASLTSHAEANPERAALPDEHRSQSLRPKRRVAEL